MDKFSLVEKSFMVRYTKEVADYCDPFCCGDKDLDEFFKYDVFLYEKELLSKAFCWISKDNPHEIVAIATLSFDGIKANILDNSSRNADQWCRAKETHMEADEPYYKKWFANRMSSLQNTMENKALPANERAAAGVEYAVGMANSVYPCWSLTQYGVGESPFFPYQSTPKKNNRRATEIIHDFISDEYSLADRPRGFDMSHQRLQTLREMSEEILGVYIAMLEPNKAAAILERMGRYLTIKHKYQNTDIAQQLKSSCDRWSDW